MRRNQLLRINVSRSGIGASIGVRGARVSAGPRGTYITLSAYGVRYRHRIDGQTRRPRYSIAEQPSVDPGIIETADVANLVDTSSEETLNDINSRLSNGTWLVPTLIALTLLTCILVWSGAGEVAGLAIGAGGALITICASSIVRVWKSTSIYYDLDAQSRKLYGYIEEGCSRLDQASMKWRYISATPTTDWKRNAGANVLTRRAPMLVTRQPAPYLETNIEPWTMSSTGLTLVFLPDRLFVWDGRRYGAVPYERLVVSAATVSFRENQRVLPDTTVIDQTWQYVRKDGGPDLRFNGNRRIPICQYGTVTLHSDHGLYVEMCVSSPNRAEEFARYLSQRTTTHLADQARCAANGQDETNKTRAVTPIAPPAFPAQSQTTTPYVPVVLLPQVMPTELWVNVLNGGITLRLGYKLLGQETTIHDLRIPPRYAREFIDILDATAQCIETLRQQGRISDMSGSKLGEDGVDVLDIGQPIPANKGTVHVALLMTKAGRGTVRLRLRGEPQFGGKAGTDDGYLTADKLNVLRNVLRARLDAHSP